MKMGMWMVVALLVLPVVACNGLSANVQILVDENYNYLTVNMTEEEAQTLFAGIFEQSDNLQVINPTVDLLPGEVSVSGEVPSGNGQTVPANLSVQMSVQNGQLNVALTSMSFAGWQGTPDMLERINSDIAAGIAEATQNRGHDAQLTDVTITDTGLSFTLRAPRDQ
jgi:hypothetical protein